MERLTRSGGLVVGVAAGVVAGVFAVLWLIKDRLGGPAPAPAEGPQEPSSHLEVAPPPTRREPDDLSELKGIGPVYQARLTDAGIIRFEDLAAAEATVVAERIEAPVSRVQGWIDEARRLVR